MKKSTKGFIFGVTTAAAAFGTYYVIKNKDKIFKSEEIINEDGDVEKKRSYVDLDNIKEKTNEAVSKTKEAAQDTWGKAKDKFDSFKKNLKKDEPADENIAEEIILPAEDVEEIAPESKPVE